jgi:transposase
MDTSRVVTAGRRQRRRHSPEFKASVIESCRRPGVSIAAIALANGLNANMLRKWVIDAEGLEVTGETKQEQIAGATGAQFIALAPPAPSMVAASTQPEIRIEVQRGSTAIKVSWPSEAASECGAWLRELLR